MEKKLFLRALCERVVDGGKEGEVITFKASTAGVKRDGLLIDQEGWMLENYRKNPVVLWAHDYLGKYLPVGKTMRVEVEGDTLMADILFDQADDFARQIERKYRTGFLNAVSVGWTVEEFKPSKGGSAPTVTKAELLDISAVPVPGDPDALMEREFRALQSLFTERSQDEPDERDGQDETLLEDDLATELRTLGDRTPPSSPSQMESTFGGGSRAGAVLNARNRSDLEEAVRLIGGVLERAKKEEGEEERIGDEANQRVNEEAKQQHAMEVLRSIANKLNLLGGL
jgi:HK97 family phage prohead protease